MKKSLFFSMTALILMSSMLEAYPRGGLNRSKSTDIMNYRDESDNSAPLTRDITGELPEMNSSEKETGFKLVKDVAQYKEADWSNATGIARGISLEEAFKLAKDNPEITYFFRMKGYSMVLEKTDGTYRSFQQGDTVFFKGEPWWGSAEGYADGYIRK